MESVPGETLQSLLTEGVAHHQAGRLPQAAALYERALALAPNHADVLHLSGLVAYQTGLIEPAIALIERAIGINPQVAAFRSNLGNALRSAGRDDEAADSYARAIALDPSYADPHHNLGLLHRATGRVEEAIACFRRAVALNPDYAEANHSLGVLLQRQGRVEDAILCFRRALAAQPGFSACCNNLGIALKQQDGLDGAIACFRRALELVPDYPDALNNLATALVESRRLDEAETRFRDAIALQSDYADAHANLGILLLSKGELRSGWAEYEWRWHQPHRAAWRPSYAAPQWMGEPAEGRTILVHAEQGFGDTIQFCRYVKLLAERGLRVVVEVQRPLFRLLRALPGADSVIVRGDTVPEVELHCPMLSLPLAFGTTLETIPAPSPYLNADSALASAWGERLAAVGQPGRRVGLVWAGNPQSRAPQASGVDRRRSIDPRLLAPLAKVPGVQLVSLQKDGPPAPEALRMADFMAEVADFADTAALIANLDLVVSVDTAVAHLAAALGKPVCLLDRHDPCWRWLTDRRDSPWYPTLRIYRQPWAGGWVPVLEELCRDLAAWTAAQGRVGLRPAIAS
jgi:tetratricopeptide (TPR) repeat protein